MEIKSIAKNNNSKKGSRARPNRGKQLNSKSQNNVSIPNNSYATTIQKALGFSRSQIVKLRYCQQVTLTPAATSVAYIVYAANGPFSPNIGASGSTGFTSSHQPKGWDQWTALYNEYVVLKSDIHVTASPPNSTAPAAGGGLMVIHLSDSATPYSSVTGVMEDGKAIYKQFNPNTSQSPCVVNHSFDARKFWDLKDIRDNQKQFGSLVTSNPAELSYFVVMFFTNDQSATSSVGPYCFVTIDYTILLTGPQDLTSS